MTQEIKKIDLMITEIKGDLSIYEQNDIIWEIYLLDKKRKKILSEIIS